MKWEHFFFPLGVLAAVVGIWAAFRKQVPAAAVLQPSSASSGVPTYDSESPGAMNIGAPVLTFNPAQAIANPLSAMPSSPTQPTSAPQYLSFNFGPSLDFSPNKQPSSDLRSQQQQTQGKGKGGCGGCGQSSGCNSCGQIISTYPDGAGACPMSSSHQKQQQAASESWWWQAAQNIASQQAYAGYGGSPNPAAPMAPATPTGSSGGAATPAAPGANIQPPIPGWNRSAHMGQPSNQPLGTYATVMNLSVQ
jgi:hypothetical protein